MVDLFIDLVALFLFFLYIHFFPFFSFCECVCVCFFVSFCLYSFTFTICPKVPPAVFLFFLVHLLELVIIGGFVYWFGCSLPSFSFLYFYFNNFISFYFIFFFLSLFLTFLLSHADDRVLVLQPGVRPVPLKWESRVQHIGPPETSQLHVTSNSESSPRDLHLNAKTQLHSMTSKL